MQSKYLRFAPAVLAFASFGPSASAAILGVSGDVREVTAPASVVEGNFEHDRRARIFFESTRVLGSRQNVDIATWGFYQNDDTFPQGFIPANTRVESYYLMADPVDNGPKNYTGSVTFDARILGIIVRSNRLDNTQYLGAPGTAYQSGGRQMDFGQGDFLLLAPDMRTLVIDWTTNGGQDSIRILTATPEPGSMALLAIGFTAFGFIARRKARAQQPSA